MSKQFRVVNFDLTNIIELANQGHSAFTKGKNGKIYVNILVGDRADKDKYDNDVYAMLNPVKEKKEAEGGKFVGNGRKYEYQAEQITQGDVSALNINEEIISNATTSTPQNPVINSSTEIADDLPF